MISLHSIKSRTLYFNLYDYISKEDISLIQFKMKSINLDVIIASLNFKLNFIFCVQFNIIHENLFFTKTQKNFSETLNGIFDFDGIQF